MISPRFANIQKSISSPVAIFASVQIHGFCLNTLGINSSLYCFLVRK